MEPRTSPIRLLIIEDDRIDQKAFKRAIDLNHLPYQYTIVASVRDARQTLRQDEFDVIVTDHNLGDGLSLDVLKLAGDTPVVVVTGAGDEEIAVKAMKAGVSDYLIKDTAQNYLRILPLTIENALRRKATERAERDQRNFADALRETAMILNSTLDLNEVLYRILATLRRVVSFDVADIILIDPDTEIGRIFHMLGWDDTVQAKMLRSEIPYMSVPNIRNMYITRQPTVVSDVASSGRWVMLNDVPIPSSYLGTPLCLGDEVMGFLNLGSLTVNFYQPIHAERLRAFAENAVTAIRNARLYKQAQELAALEERQRLARDLHDSVTQTLFTASLVSASLVRLRDQNPEAVYSGLTEIHQLTRGALAEMRMLLLELRPRALIETSLVDLVQQLVDAAAGRGHLDVTFTHSEADPACRLPPDVQVVFYRIAQEALNNVVRHAGAKRVWVKLACEGDCAALQVRDNGRGFDPANLPPNHFGVRIMSERAQSVHAECVIESGSEQGTLVSVQWRALPDADSLS